MSQLKGFAIEKFKGLNLRDDPMDVGMDQAINLLDVSLSNGVVQPRKGTNIWANKAVADTSSWSFLHALPSGNRILAGYSTTIETRDPDGTVVSTQAGGAARTACEIATAAQSAGTYVGVSGATARFINSSGVISIPAFTGHTPTAGLLAATTKTFRLVSTDGAHRVWFSNQGDPLTFNVNNFVDLWPNDGEVITYMAAWRDLLFVFKKTKFAVFYGESTDDDNTTIFDYYGTYNIPAIVATGGKPVAISPDGLFYMSRDGVYFTTGAKPERVSGVLDPLFLTQPLTDQTGGGGGVKPDYTLSLTNPWLHYHQDILYVVYPNTWYSIGGPMMLVYDTLEKQWTRWSVNGESQTPGITALCSQPTGTSTSNEPVLFAATAYCNFPGFIDDLNSTISVFTDTDYRDHIVRAVDGSSMQTVQGWYYQSGYTDFGTFARKRTRYVDLYGTRVDDGTDYTALYLEGAGSRINNFAIRPSGIVILKQHSQEELRYGRANLPLSSRMISYILSGTGPGSIGRMEFRYSVAEGDL